MAKTILVCGYGPGISEAVGRKFGGEGFRVALVARGREKVDRGAAALGESGIEARGFACDLSDPAAVGKLIVDVREAFGPITVIHWNAYAGVAGDLMKCTPDDVRKVLDVAVTGMVTAVQAAHTDMKGQDDAAVLVTGGGFANYDPGVDGMIVQWNVMGLGVAKAAQHKLVGLLSQKLAGDGIYVGEVVVMGMVKGTAFDSGQATVEPKAVGERFWELYRERRDLAAPVG